MNYQEVVQALDAILTAKKREIEGFSQYSGGWENWLKIEMTGKWSFGQVFPEQHVWDDKRQIDLWFPDTRFGVELKCLGLNRIAHKEHIISEIASTYRSFCQDALVDVEKVRTIPQGGTGMAVVIIPTWVPEDRLVTLKSELSGVTYAWSYMGNGGFVVGIHRSHYL
ncbi:hypothetical protein [Pseudomonas mangrovi]|uniref:Uncharacterized protein n=1 Tax=Pseudomonas mangrovi TaxID=2161748 RepID=A0A2T5PDC3_9PSED|nr:hypothetical protein [Pseudomonas mangrovi]PTU75741.1 hypothetical protein DBO85_03460 [Pseudomonas mangrovi]